MERKEKPRRAKLMVADTEKRLPQREGGRQPGITVRQVKRLVGIYRAEGNAGLASHRVGQPSNRQLKEPLRDDPRPPGGALPVISYPPASLRRTTLPRFGC